MNRERDKLLDKINQVTPINFTEIAYELFEYQRKHNLIYSDYLKGFKSINEMNRFLPISAFKTQTIVSNKNDLNLYFESSGTTSSINSKHYIFDLNWYLKNCVRGFELAYGKIQGFCFLALLPHYLERQNSSLIAMVNHFISLSNYKESGFFLNDEASLIKRIKHCKTKNIPTILFGVSFALLDFSEKYKINFPELIIMETGGMKGRRAEITREELHNEISNSFGTKQIHSEYGMTELLSQAYSKEKGIFYPPPTLKIIISEITDPFSKERNGKTGLVNIIDLANIDSCAFIATEDLGIVYDDGSFIIQGRLDASEIRGCNLLVQDI